MKLHGSLLLAVAAATVLTAQAGQTPQFRTGVDVFQLDVSVLDRDHQPVRGLTAAKFTVLENGKPQRIVNFEEIEFPEYDGPLTDGIEDNAPDVAMPRYADRRLISVVMDDFGWPMTPACSPDHPELIYVAKEAGRFIANSMGTSDLVAVTLTRDLRYYPDFTNNRGKLAGNIAEFRPTSCAERAYLASVARSGFRSVGLVTALDELIDRLAKLPQHSKAIVIVGIPPNMIMGGAGDLRLRDVMMNARRVGITISGVDLLGLTVERRMGPDVLLTLAENTGGHAVVGSNDLASGLTQIFREHHAYYLIGYQQTGPRDGKFRRLDVHVDVPGAVVRARSGYEAPGGVEMVKQPAFYDPEVDREVAELDTPGNSRRLFTRATLGPGSIDAVAELASSELTAGKWASGADVEFTVTRATGSVVTSAKARIGPGSRSVGLNIPLRDLLGQPVDLSAAPFHVSVHLTSPAESADDGVDAVSGGALLGQPTIARSGSGARAVLRPVAEPRFLRSERIHIEWPVLKPLEERRTALLRRTGEPMTHVVALTESDADGRHLIAIDFLLAPLAEGDYVIELAAKSGTEAERKLVAFRLAQ